VLGFDTTDANHVADRAPRDVLDAGLAIARRARGWSCVALPAPVVAPSAILAAWRSAQVVAWSSSELSLVGVGVAHELRGRGDARWTDLVASASLLAIDPVIAPDHAPIADWIRPRFIGGAAFAPGAADRTPWGGFGDAWFALPRWTYLHRGATAWLVLAVDAADARYPERWHAELAAFRSALAAGFVARPQPPMTTIDRGDRSDWRARIHAITDAIANHACAKIVAARHAVVTLAGEVRAPDLLAQLEARHADCVRVVVRPPGGGTLVAATPERLVRLDGTTVACDALAGSHARADANSAGALLASTKDRREHQLVVDAIVDALRAHGATVHVPDGPGVRALRHVLHLHTPITATLREPRHVLELAATLHPTPAVGGTPTAIAKAWIADREPVPRGWYAAPVGWFDTHGNGELAVAIRSGLLVGDHAHLWAGAGIVAGSDAELELAETDVKLRAMLGALGVDA
jgi:menaquinone-specific isochorismate synthase